LLAGFNVPKHLPGHNTQRQTAGRAFISASMAAEQTKDGAKTCVAAANKAAKLKMILTLVGYWRKK
jgi:hypothetical protein